MTYLLHFTDEAESQAERPDLFIADPVVPSEHVRVWL